MNIKNTYPPVEKRKLQRKKLLSIIRWPYLAVACICPVINLLTGGKAWSTVTVMSMYMVWTMLLSPDLVEYNRISQFIKFITCSCVLLALIDVFLAPGWAMEVVPLVCCGGLIISGVLFFTDFEKQKQNMLPLLLLIFVALAGSGIGLCVWHEKNRWPLEAMGGTAAILLFACIVTMKNEFVRELRRRFHTK